MILTIANGKGSTGKTVFSASFAALSGTDLALVVTEPSLSGFHDLERVIKTTKFFSTQPVCCINKGDSSPELSQGRPFVLVSDAEAAHSIREIWDNIIDIFNLGEGNHEKNYPEIHH